MENFPRKFNIFTNKSPLLQYSKKMSVKKKFIIIFQFQVSCFLIFSSIICLKYWRKFFFLLLLPLKTYSICWSWQTNFVSLEEEEQKLFHNKAITFFYVIRNVDGKIHKLIVYSNPITFMSRFFDYLTINIMIYNIQYSTTLCSILQYFA